MKIHPDDAHIMKPSPFAALLPCSPASRPELSALPSSRCQGSHCAVETCEEDKTFLGAFKATIRRWFSKTSSPAPLDAAVRNALNVITYDALPPLSSEEFERLYCEILEDEVRQGRHAAEIINRFMEEREK